jgi:hypothetical protein
MRATSASDAPAREPRVSRAYRPRAGLAVSTSCMEKGTRETLELLAELVTTL